MEKMLDGIVGEVMQDPEAQNQIAKFLGLDKLNAQLKAIQDMQIEQNKVLNSLLTILRPKK